jgi:hypothetical protein
MVLAPGNQICFRPLVTESPVMGGEREEEEEDEEEEEAGVTDN